MDTSQASFFLRWLLQGDNLSRAINAQSTWKEWAASEGFEPILLEEQLLHIANQHQFAVSFESMLAQGQSNLEIAIQWIDNVLTSDHDLSDLDSLAGGTLIHSHLANVQSSINKSADQYFKKTLQERYDPAAAVSDYEHREQNIVGGMDYESFTIKGPSRTINFSWSREDNGTRFGFYSGYHIQYKISSSKGTTDNYVEFVNGGNSEHPYHLKVLTGGVGKHGDGQTTVVWDYGSGINANLERTSIGDHLLNQWQTTIGKAQSVATTISTDTRDLSTTPYYRHLLGKLIDSNTKNPDKALDTINGLSKEASQFSLRNVSSLSMRQKMRLGLDADYFTNVVFKDLKAQFDNKVDSLIEKAENLLPPKPPTFLQSPNKTADQYFKNTLQDRYDPAISDYEHRFQFFYGDREYENFTVSGPTRTIQLTWTREDNGTRFGFYDGYTITLETTSSKGMVTRGFSLSNAGNSEHPFQGAEISGAQGVLWAFGSGIKENLQRTRLGDHLLDQWQDQWKPALGKVQFVVKTLSMDASVLSSIPYFKGSPGKFIDANAKNPEKVLETIKILSKEESQFSLKNLSSLSARQKMHLAIDAEYFTHVVLPDHKAQFDSNVDSVIEKVQQSFFDTAKSEILNMKTMQSQSDLYRYYNHVVNWGSAGGIFYQNIKIPATVYSTKSKKKAQEAAQTASIEKQFYQEKLLLVQDIFLQTEKKAIQTGLESVQ